MHSKPSLAPHSDPTERALALRSLPDDELLRRLHELVSHSRRVEADLIAHIGEVDERRLFARQAFPSMFAYCTQALHLSEAEAYRRITVARAARQHTVLLGMLRDGRLHLSGMALLVPLLTPENRNVVLARAIHRSKREIEQLVAELQPRPDVPSGMRKLPGRRSRLAPQASPTVDQTLPSTSELFPGTVKAMDPARLPSGSLDTSIVSSVVDVAPAGFGGPAARVTPNAGVEPLGRFEAASPVPSPFGLPVASAGSQPVGSKPAVMEPLSPARYKVRFTASAELRDKLERLAALMRSQVPDGDLAKLIESAVSEKLERLEARRFGKTAAPRKTLPDTDTSPVSRHIPAAVRRAVRERDQGRCRFVGEQGRRCRERHRLEFHHRRPFGMGGDHTPDNISLMCPVHNRHLAERDYGQAAVRRRQSAESTPPGPPAQV